jgi:hypothetical protein
MAKPVFKHDEDDGDLSIFASGDVIVLACEHGHYWAIDAKQHSPETIKSAVQRLLPPEGSESLFKAMLS